MTTEAVNNSLENIVLDFPLTIDGREVTSLALRRPKVRDLLEAQKSGGNDSEQELALFGRLTGVNPEELRNLDMRDYRKVQRAYEAFLS
ncbi:MAG: phage tail assembly protein [Deltaproteobacteria bacterium]|nr:phage tail assembly protein [Deltaproteobacteria bacterium]